MVQKKFTHQKQGLNRALGGRQCEWLHEGVVFRIVNVGALAEGEVQEHLRVGRPASQLPRSIGR